MPVVKWKTGVYLIVNLVNRKVYVGGAYKSFALRFANHRRQLTKGKHVNIHLQRAWNKYGPDGFSFDVVERCAPHLVKAREQYWIDEITPHNPKIGYNISPNVGSGFKGMHTEDGLRRISIANTGKKWSDEAKLRHSTAMMGNQHLLGHVPSEETRMKISAAMKGRQPSELCRRVAAERMRLRNQQNPPRKGNPCSDEHRRKLSEAARRRKKCI